MITRSTALQLVLAGGLILGFTTLAMTITPASHDYGQVAVNGLKTQTFDVTLPPNTPRGTTLSVTLTGNVQDFGIVETRPLPNVDVYNVNIAGNHSYCAITSQAITCQQTVEFRPQLVGPKLATLIVTDNHGNRVTAALKGVGVAPLCTHVVVPCNYSHLFSGTFGWRSVLNSPGTTETENVDVKVVNGDAFCVGGATSHVQGRTRTGIINGPGLIGIEFLPDPTHTWVYRITVACPSVAWPATADEPATASEPAELGRGEQSSDKQPAGGVRMPLEQAIARLSTLQGRMVIPGNDPANGVTGSLTISWNLVRS